jgi:hypothetical protein
MDCNKELLIKGFDFLERELIKKLPENLLDKLTFDEIIEIQKIISTAYKTSKIWNTNPKDTMYY